MSDMPPVTGGPPIPPPPEGRASTLPWEAPDAGLGTLLPTVGRFVTRPIESFGMMSLTVDLVRPLAYYVALLLFAVVLGQIWNAVFRAQMLEVVRTILESSGQGALWQQIAPGMTHVGALQIVLGLVVAPLVYLVILFVWTLLVHGALALLGGAPRGFAATLRVMAYAGTAWLASILPLVGGLVGFVWYLVLGMIGLATAHRTEGWKAALAVILPLALCCLCCVGAAFLFGAAIAQAIQHAAP